MRPHTPKPSLLPPPGPIVQQCYMLPTGALCPLNFNPKTNSSFDPPLPPLFLSALSIRYRVFTLGQNCNPALEIDADDAASWHWVIFAIGGDWKKGMEMPAATIRLVPAQVHVHEDGVGEGEGTEEVEEIERPDLSNSEIWDGKEPFAKIGRLATVEEFRGRGYGSVLVETALRFAGEHAGDMGRGWKGLVLIHAQVGVRGWYEKLGWVGDEGMGRWVEEGIEHLGMWRRVDVTD